MNSKCPRCFAESPPDQNRCAECGQVLRRPVALMPQATSLKMNVDSNSTSDVQSPDESAVIDRTTNSVIKAGDTTLLPPTRKMLSSGDSDTGAQPADGSMRFPCACGKKLRVKGALAGKSIRCPKCQAVVLVPNSESGRSRESQTSATSTPGPVLKNAASAVEPLNDRRVEPDVKESASKSGLFLLPETEAAALLTETIHQALRRKSPLMSGDSHGGLSSRKLRQLLMSLADNEGYSQAEIETRQKTYLELGRSRDPQVLETLVAGLRDEEAVVREAVVAALGELPGTDAFSYVLPMLSDSNSEIRRAAITSIQKLQDVRAIRPLLAFTLLHPQARHLTLDVIVKIGSAAVPELLAIVREKEPELAFNAIHALGRISDPEAVPELLSAMNYLLSPVLRACVIEALGLIADKRAVATLIEALKDPHSVLRANAAAAVLRIPDPGFLRPLINALADEDADVRRLAAIGLGELGDRKALPQLTRLLQRWRDLIVVDEALVAATAEAVGKIGDPSAVSALLPLLEATDETVLMKTLAALRRIKAPEAGPAMNRMLSDPRPAIRRLTIDILGRSGDAAALEPLLEILRREPSRELRAIAARSLGELKLSAAIPVLEEALRDEMVVRLQAVIALGRIKHKRSLPGLMAMLRDGAPEVRYQALLAIGRFGDPKAVKAVSVLLMDDDPMVKRGAIAALEQLGQHGAENAEKLIRDVRWRDRVMGIVPRAVWILIPSRKIAGAIVSLAFVLVGGFFLRSSTGQQPRAVVNRGGVSELSFSGDGDRLAVGRSRGLSELWSISEKKVLANAVGGRSPTYAADGQSALIVMNQQLVKWSLDSDEKPNSEKPLDPAKLKHWCVTPDAKWGAAVATNGAVTIWDLSQIRKSRELDLGLENSVAVAISPDGSWIAGSNSVGTVTVFDTGSGKSILRLQEPTNEPLVLLAISSNRQWVAASSGRKGGAILWELDESGARVKSSRQVAAQGPFATIALAFFPDDERLLVAALNGIKVFSLKSEDVLSITHSLSKLDACVLDAAGKRLALGSSDDSQILLIDLASATTIAELDTQ